MYGDVPEVGQRRGERRGQPRRRGQALRRAMNARPAVPAGRDTTAVMPSGLDEPGQFTSAYDLALIGRAAAREPVLRAYASTQVYQFPDKAPTPGKKRGTYEIFSPAALPAELRRRIRHQERVTPPRPADAHRRVQPRGPHDPRHAAESRTRSPGARRRRSRTGRTPTPTGSHRSGELVEPVGGSAEPAKPVVRHAAPAVVAAAGASSRPALILAASIGLAGGLLVLARSADAAVVPAESAHHRQRPRSSRERRYPRADRGPAGDGRRSPRARGLPLTAAPEGHQGHDPGEGQHRALARLLTRRLVRVAALLAISAGRVSPCLLRRRLLAAGGLAGRATGAPARLARRHAGRGHRHLAGGGAVLLVQPDRRVVVVLLARLRSPPRPRPG